MRVLLVSCYELGHQPLALASPAAFLIAEGLEVECLDLAVEPLDVEQIERADFVGISIPMHTAIRLGVKAAERVRSINPDCHLCFYGLYASLNDDYLLRKTADSVIGAEFEGPLVELVKALCGDADAVPVGVSTREHRSEPFLGKLQFLQPHRSSLPPLDKYAHLHSGDEFKTVGYVEASRGCAHECLHCPITPVYGGRFRIVQRDVVRRDLAALVEMGAQHITFGDPDFLNGPTHSLRIARTLHEDFPELSFDITTKVEHILQHRGSLDELRALGCIFILSAVESVSDTILRHLEKGHTRADVVEALRLTRSAGISLRPSLLPFTPWTSMEDYLDLLDFVEEHELLHHVDPVQLAIRLLVPPGSSLLGTPQMEPFLGELDEQSFSYAWKHPDSRLDALHSEVSKLVEAAVQSREDAPTTFYRVKDLALSAAMGRRFSPWSARPISQETPPPRLTESWFC
ncbi:MAG: CUAEP/CCAEP-tail radical SAM protein [Deltaproteobacteria bacterium]|nr:CUAEP/CCAEP-tail radical SAM protein [Deltaproteobacteria bacterium]